MKTRTETTSHPCSLIQTQDMRRSDMKTYIVRTYKTDKEVEMIIEKWEGYGCYLHSWQYDREAGEWLLIFKEG